MGREAQRLHLPVKTQCFVHLGISCELGNRKKNGTGETCFAHVGISCELGNRKKWDERHMQHLPVKTQCFLQFGISCELGNREKWDGKHKGCTYL